MPVNIGGKQYIIASDDNYLEHLNGDFEPAIVSLFQSLTAANDVVLDIGANIGCTALLFGEFVKLVYAFEPSPTTYALLERNVRKSGLQNIILQNIGLGAESAECSLTFSASNRSGGFVSDNVQTSGGHISERIIIRPLDEMTKTLNITHLEFIKIDVEGFEGQVLRGAKQTLSAFKPIVVLELNHWCLNAFQRTSIPDFFDQLRSIFPVLFAVDQSSYLDLHNGAESYMVMYHHILHNRFPNIVAAFDEDRLSNFLSVFEHRFIP